MLRSVKNQWKRIPTHLRYAIGLFAFSRAILTAIGGVTQLFFRHHPGDFPLDFIQRLSLEEIWHQWDSLWYVSLAREGYTFSYPFDPSQYSSVGFFPLYSILMRGVAFITHNYAIAGLVVSAICLFVAVHFLYKLVRLDFDEKTSLRAVLFLFIFPTSFYLSGVLAESLFLALTLMAFYFARKGRWFWTGVIGGLVVLTKSFGIILLLPLFLIYFKEKKYRLIDIESDILFLSIIPSALIGFCLYGYALTGDALAYFHIQSGAWHHSMGDPFQVISNGITLDNPHDYINAVFILISLSFLVFLYKTKKISRIYSLYGIILPLFNPMTGGLVGTLRYMTFNIPLYLGLAVTTEKETNREITLMSMCLLQGALMVFWSIGTFWFMA